MKAALAVAALVPSLLFAQQTASIPGAVRVEIRSADTTRVVNVKVEVGGGLFESIGVLRPAPGTVHCEGRDGCMVTTPSELTLTPYNGTGRVTAIHPTATLHVTVISTANPERRLVASGPQVTFERTGRGELTVRAERATTDVRRTGR
jgi:hypothetical protein